VKLNFRILLAYLAGCGWALGSPKNGHPIWVSVTRAISTWPKNIYLYLYMAVSFLQTFSAAKRK